MIASLREHFCEGPEEMVRVTNDRNIRVFRPNGNCIGSLPDRSECKVYNDLSADEVAKKYGLKKTEVPVKKRTLAFRILRGIQVDSSCLLPEREVEVKFDSRLGYGDYPA